MIEPPPESQRTLLDQLTEAILRRLPKEMDCRARGRRVIAKLRDLVGDLPASADHHHSSRFGLLQHSLEVALKMLEEFEKRLLAFEKSLRVDVPPDLAVFNIAADPLRTQYLCFLAGLGHDLGKLFDIELVAGERRWSPLNETYAEFLRQVKREPVLRWNEKRVRGGHAQFSPWLMHHLLSPADMRFIGLERLQELVAALTGTHSPDQATPLARVVSKVDQQSVEQAAPEWMTKQPNSKVNLLMSALRTMICTGELSVNCPGGPVYVTGGKAAVVVPRSMFAAREYLKIGNPNLKLPPNSRLYDLLAQAEVVEANEDLQCVQRIKVPGKDGPVELSAVIFHPGTIIPQRILPALPIITFEVVPEEPNQPDIKPSSSTKPSPVKQPEPESATIPQTTVDPR